MGNQEDMARPQADRALSLRDEACSASSPLRGNDPSRDYRGRFLPKLRHTPDGSREWFIWSKYWNCWHRRDPETGGACGYTDDISQAGLFPRDKASSYNDDRNRPYHFSEKIADLKAEIRKHEQAIARLQASAMSARQGQDPQGLGAEPASAVPPAADAQGSQP